MSLPDCILCAKCCYCDPVLLRGVDEGVVPDELLVPLPHHKKYFAYMKMVDGHCVALDPATNLCRIYHTRPSTCVQFERGSAACLTAIADNP